MKKRYNQLLSVCEVFLVEYSIVFNLTISIDNNSMYVVFNLTIIFSIPPFDL